MNRCAELNRREVDEKAEHLRLLSWLTGLITSFTMTTLVEFQFDATVSTVCDYPNLVNMLLLFSSRIVFFSFERVLLRIALGFCSANSVE